MYGPHFPEISTSATRLSSPAFVDSISSVNHDHRNNSSADTATSSSESSIASMPSATTELDNSGIGTTATATIEDIPQTTTSTTKTTEENDRTTTEMNSNSESISSSTSSTTNIEIATNANEETSHREHGRALNLTNVATEIQTPPLSPKAKALNDLSDVSMDDDTFGDGNGPKEEMIIAQTQHKECESKVIFKMI